MTAPMPVAVNEVSVPIGVLVYEVGLEKQIPFGEHLGRRVSCRFATLAGRSLRATAFLRADEHVERPAQIEVEVESEYATVTSH